MKLEEKISKINVLSTTIQELKQGTQTPKLKLTIQKLQQEMDRITMA